MTFQLIKKPIDIHVRTNSYIYLMNDHLHTIEPQNAFKKYISLYYFIKNDDPDFISKHFSFPHTYNALSIYKNSSFEFAANYVRVSPGNDKNYSTLIQIKKQAPLLVEINGKVDRITILFKDFGINNFLNSSLSRDLKNHDTRVNIWNDDVDFNKSMDRIFDTESLQERATLLEEFLLHKLHPIQIGNLEKAVELLWDFESNYTIEQIAGLINTPIRTFNRNFKEMIGVSPAEYRRIAQFRYSLTNKLYSSQFKRLTDLGYQSNFYDQSYFNKIYKKLTGSNPKAFFKAIEQAGDERLIFQFIKA